MTVDWWRQSSKVWAWKKVKGIREILITIVCLCVCVRALCRQLPMSYGLIAVHTGRDMSQTGCLLKWQRRRGRDQIWLQKDEWEGRGRHGLLGMYVWGAGWADIHWLKAVCGERWKWKKEEKNVSVNNCCACPHTVQYVRMRSIKLRSNQLHPFPRKHRCMHCPYHSCQSLNHQSHTGDSSKTPHSTCQWHIAKQPAKKACTGRQSP